MSLNLKILIYFDVEVIVRDDYFMLLILLIVLCLLMITLVMLMLSKFLLQEVWLFFFVKFK